VSFVVHCRLRHSAAW